jgi:hypothetical protein
MANNSKGLTISIGHQTFVKLGAKYRIVFEYIEELASPTVPHFLGQQSIGAVASTLQLYEVVNHVVR